MSYYYKLIIVVIAGSIASWFAVQKLVLSTDYMAEKFTVDSVNKFNVGSDLIIDEERSDELTVALAEAPDDEPDEQLTEDEDASQELSAEELAKKLAQEEEPSEEPANETELIEAIVAETDQANDQDTGSDTTENTRSDSDADMQAINEKTVKQPTSAEKGQSLSLDNKLASNVQPSTIKKAAEPVQALDLAYALPAESDCVMQSDDYPRVGVLYRPTSFAIKGQSLTNIDKLVALYKKCGGKLLVFENKLDTDESEQRLIQLRQDEVKYYLLQRRVPKDDMVFPDNS